VAGVAHHAGSGSAQIGGLKPEAILIVELHPKRALAHQSFSSRSFSQIAGWDVESRHLREEIDHDGR
jgi:hypothetical protein